MNYASAAIVVIGVVAVLIAVDWIEERMRRKP